MSKNKRIHFNGLHCGRCCIVKPTTEFYTNKSNKDGFATYCKGCAKEYRKKYKKSPFNHRKRKQKGDLLECTACDLFLQPENFYSSNRREDGKSPRCKACHTTYNKTTDDVICGICKATKPASDFHRNATMPNGCSNRCKECSKQYQQTAPRRFAECKQKAASKGKAFNLTLDTFTKITSNPCHYCNDHRNSHVGIDRINSGKGYVQGNVLPCCWTCNAMKNSHSLKFFYEHITLILANRKPLPSS